jgi:hypothetical protein
VRNYCAGVFENKQKKIIFTRIPQNNTGFCADYPHGDCPFQKAAGSIIGGLSRGNGDLAAEICRIMS